MVWGSFIVLTGRGLTDTQWLEGWHSKKKIHTRTCLTTGPINWKVSAKRAGFALNPPRDSRKVLEFWMITARASAKFCSLNMFSSSTMIDFRSGVPVIERVSMLLLLRKKQLSSLLTSDLTPHIDDQTMVYVLFVPGANPNSAVENVIVQQSFCKMFKRGKLAWHRHDGNLNCCIACRHTYNIIWLSHELKFLARAVGSQAVKG